MRLEGSCLCGAVKFSCISRTPYAVNRCYCSICRKAAGGGGYSINIMGEYDTLDIEGEENLKLYRHDNNDRNSYAEDGRNAGGRYFCTRCGTVMWNHNPRHGQWFYPIAGVIDTPLPVPPEQKHFMLAHKPDWVLIPDEDEANPRFDHYPDEGIEDWHKSRGLYDESRD